MRNLVVIYSFLWLFSSIDTHMRYKNSILLITVITLTTYFWPLSYSRCGFSYGNNNGTRNDLIVILQYGWSYGALDETFYTNFHIVYNYYGLSRLYLLLFPIIYLPWHTLSYAIATFKLYLSSFKAEEFVFCFPKMFFHIIHSLYNSSWVMLVKYILAK